MSTIPEIIVSVHAGLKALGLSTVTDACLPDALKPVDIDEIIQIANSQEENRQKIIRGVIAGLK
jgi:purine-nucleoside phosphorylase